MNPINHIKNQNSSIFNQWASLTISDKLIVAIALVVFGLFSYIIGTLKLRKETKIEKSSPDELSNQKIQDIAKPIQTENGENKQKDSTSKVDESKINTSTEKTKSQLTHTGEQPLLIEGGSYIGELLDGKPHGKGSVKFENGTYTGEFANGEFCGEGEYIINDIHYKGTFKVGNHFLGVAEYKDGKKIEGEFFDGDANGYCVVKNKNGSTFEGIFKAGNRNGKGTYTSSTITYEGYYLNDKQHGEAILTHVNNFVYKGMFIEDQMTGKGIKTYTIGRVEEGCFLDGYLIGEGNIQYEWNENTYKGGFLNGVPHGKGVYHYTTGKWKKYDGEWLHAMKHGVGTLYTDEGTYEGEFHKDKMHNQIKFTDLNGNVINQIYNKGVLQK
ncbi:MAG: hypothetical protein H0W88_04980 [Parachlamydiaceae bacterium]|nr:hypothetical protein [Parachlamydiaceae bacterium]